MELDGLDAFKERVPVRLGRRRARSSTCPGCGTTSGGCRSSTEFEGDPVIEGDPRLLKIVVGNLVNNADQVRARGDAGPAQARRPRDGELVFSVRNEGVGISAGGHPRPALQAVRAPEAEGHRGRQGLGPGALHLQDRSSTSTRAASGPNPSPGHGSSSSSPCRPRRPRPDGRPCPSSPGSSSRPFPY